MRQFLNLIESQDDITAFFIMVHQETPLRRPLRESRRHTLLMEGPLAKKIKATIDRVTSNYGEMQYETLARITSKALDVFQGDEQVSKTLGRVLAVGKLAAKNRVLLAALAGIAGTLIGLAASPASAQTAAHQIDNALSGDIDRIIHSLEMSGIQVAQTDLPQGLSAVAQKAAAALRAIQQFEFAHGLPMDATRELSQSVRIDADITTEASRMIEDIFVKTPDGQVVIAHIRTVVENGKVVSDSASGVRFELFDHLGNLEPAQQKAVEDFISGNLPMADGSGPMAMLRAKTTDLALLVAAIATKNHASHVSLGPTGVQVQEAVEVLGEDGMTTKERKEFKRLHDRMRDGELSREDYQRFFNLKRKGKNFVPANHKPYRN